MQFVIVIYATCQENLQFWVIQINLKVSDSAGAFLISSNFIDITLHMQNAKQLDKFSWSKHIKPL